MTKGRWRHHLCSFSFDNIMTQHYNDSFHYNIFHYSFNYLLANCINCNGFSLINCFSLVISYINNLGCEQKYHFLNFFLYISVTSLRPTVLPVALVHLCSFSPPKELEESDVSAKAILFSTFVHFSVFFCLLLFE